MKNLSRREFMKKSGIITTGAFLAGSYSPLMGNYEKQHSMKSIYIDSVDSDFEREPLIRPFGFAGGFMTEIWQSASYLRSSSGIHKIGLCTQNVLWSDGKVFAGHSESGGNAIMYALTERAMQMAKGQSFKTPLELLDNLFPELEEYAKKITAHQQLRQTFTLNAMVGLDNAAWLLYAEENGLRTFDEMIPQEYRQAMSHRHDKVAGIPLMAYSIPIDEIIAAVEEGYFFMKIKIGQPGTQKEMLEKDKARLTAIHNAIGHARTQYTGNGRLPYYFDANGRYQEKETLLRLIDHAEKIGALDQIAVIEEPFPEELKVDVSDIPVNLAADESAHTDKDALERIQLGYGSIAVKPIAKTLSMSLRVAKVAHQHNVPCFCADLTVNPVLVEWNKNFAARLGPFPGIGDIGLMESNGHQNYKNWDTMMSYHPRNSAPWVRVKQGVYETDDEFYRTGGGIFDSMPHYESMFEPERTK
ncbi:MAG: enolase C-terminal domain-like protein [Bacteroidales bacterium]